MKNRFNIFKLTTDPVKNKLIEFKNWEFKMASSVMIVCSILLILFTVISGSYLLCLCGLVFNSLILFKYYRDIRKGLNDLLAIIDTFNQNKSNTQEIK